MLIEEATCSLILSNSRLHPFRNFSLEAFIPLLSSWENGVKQVHDADEFKEACS